MDSILRKPSAVKSSLTLAAFRCSTLGLWLMSEYASVPNRLRTCSTRNISSGSTRISTRTIKSGSTGITTRTIKSGSTGISTRNISSAVPSQHVDMVPVIASTPATADGQPMVNATPFGYSYAVTYSNQHT
ncbi:hypothetical protein EMCRGX_G035011 [Ephydatia muelleri]